MRIVAPRVSILLPTYNGEAYLRAQLRSILDQTVEDFRLLIVDDGSSDATPHIIAQAQRDDPRVQVLDGGRNEGQRRRLEQLAAASTTDLIAIADQDDLWDRDKLALLLDGLGQAAICFGSSHLIDGEGRDLRRVLSDNLPPAYRPGERLSYLFRPLVSAHALVARRVLLNARTFGRALPFDWLMSVEAAFGAGLAYEPAAITRHRLHATNQANGIFTRPYTRERVISRYALRRAMPEWTQGRVRLLGMFEHLAYSDNVMPAVRRDMAALYAGCADAWLGGHKASMAALKQLFQARLRPWAGSERDWAFAEVNLATLCATSLSPARLLARARRLSFLAEQARSGVSAPV